MKSSSSLKWIIKRSKRQNLKMILLVLANAVFSVLSVLFAFAIKEIIDSATGTETLAPSMRRLISYAVAISIIVILQFVFRVVINGLTEHIRAKLEMEYKSYLFGQILVKKQDKISGYHSGELMNRLTNDVSVVADGYSGILPTVVSAFARLLCAVVALIILDWIFAVAFTVAGIMVFAVIGVLRTMLKSLHKKAQETDGKVRSFMQECIENLLAVKAFSINGKIERQAQELQEENFKVKMQRKNYSVTGHAIYNFIFSAGYLFALIYGGVKILGDLLSYGSLSAILQLVNNVQVPFASLSNVLPKYYAMVASAERLMEIEDVESEVDTPYVDAKSTYENMLGIKIDGVEFSYDREKVLVDASFYINKGDFVMIEGSSGVGKSTLIKLLLGVYGVDGGNIEIKTNDGAIAVDKSTRTLFSYVPQGNMIFSGTIKENVTFVNESATEEQIENALKISCAYEFISKLPAGLETVVGENGVGLSEGQVQRLAVARAILCDAPIVLLDEATSALDERTEEELLKNLKALENVTLIIITHKKAAAEICNRRIKINQKNIVELT